MRHVQRDPDTGQILGHYANPQRFVHPTQAGATYETVEVPEDHADLAAFQAEREARRGLRIRDMLAMRDAQIADLTARVVELERRVIGPL